MTFDFRGDIIISHLRSPVVTEKSVTSDTYIYSGESSQLGCKKLVTVGDITYQLFQTSAIMSSDHVIIETK